MTSAGVAIGVFPDPFPSDPGALPRYTRMSGRPPAIVHWFSSWALANRVFDARAARRAADAGAVPMISWQPWDGLDPLLAGANDAYVRAYAEAVADHDGPVLVRFGHEMNAPGIPWFDRPDRYRTAWRGVRAIFRDAGATNARWVWSPYVVDRGIRGFEAYYPGDDDVDWVALDGYNWGGRWWRWRSFERVFGESHRRIRRLAPMLPLMLAEVGCAERGGDKARWIRRTFLETVPTRYADIDAVVWFNKLRPDHADWRVDSSPGALAAWREVIAHPLYQRRLLGV